MSNLLPLRTFRPLNSASLVDVHSRNPSPLRIPHVFSLILSARRFRPLVPLFEELPSLGEDVKLHYTASFENPGLYGLIAPLPTLC